MKKLFVTSSLMLAMLSGCASSVHVAVDPGSIANQEKFNQDLKLCTDVAKTYDLSQDTGINAVAGAAVGGVAVAGIATAVAGAIFLPAIPFIIAGTVAGGGVMGGATKAKETKAREGILAQCLQSRGYKAFGSAGI